MVSSGSNICPTSSGYKTSNRSLGTYIYGLTAHPSNSGELYALSDNNSKLYKITVGASVTSNTLNLTKGSRWYNGTSSAARLYFYYPLGLHYDDTNDRLIASGYNSRTVEIIDTVFIKIFLPRIYEISKAELTVILAPKKVKNTEISIIGIPNFIGFLTIILESLSLDSSVFSVWFEEFW